MKIIQGVLITLVLIGAGIFYGMIVKAWVNHAIASEKQAIKQVKYKDPASIAKASNCKILVAGQDLTINCTGVKNESR